MESEAKWDGLMDEARSHFRTADHMAYVSLSILKENRMLIKIISELAKSASCLIRAWLYYEHAHKRIQVYKDPQKNMETFVTKIAPRYLSKQELKNIINLLNIEKKHNLAPVEFVKRNTFVILMGDKYETINVALVREFLNSVRVSMAKFPKLLEKGDGKK